MAEERVNHVIGPKLPQLVLSVATYMVTLITLDTATALPLLACIGLAVTAEMVVYLVTSLISIYAVIDRSEELRLGLVGATDGHMVMVAYCAATPRLQCFEYSGGWVLWLGPLMFSVHRDRA